MPSTPTTRNRLNRQGTGDNAGTWGVVLNEQVSDRVDEALDGYEAIAVAANVTLTSVNYLEDQSRKRVLKFTGAGGFTVTIPGVQKWYIIHNACTAAVTVKTAGGTGAVINPATITPIYCDGTNTTAATNMWPFADGTAAAPGAYFAAAPGTGMYRNGASSIALSVNGATVANFSNSVGNSFNAALTVAGLGTFNGIAPSADNTYSSGTSGARWSDIRSSTGHFGAGTFSTSACALRVAFTGAGTIYGIGLRSQTDAASVYAEFSAPSGTGGSITGTNTSVAYNTSSDGRLKEDFRPVDTGGLIDAIAVYDFRWKSTGERAIGVVAQELHKVEPRAVHVGETWGVDYSKLVPHLLAEVKALRARVAALEAG